MSNETKVTKSGLEVIERNRGCYNCKNWENQEKARTYWQHRRLDNLNHAKLIAKLDPDGENGIQVVNIRRMVNNVDHSVASGTFGLCLAGKAEADLVHHAYLCSSWSGVSGSSLVTSGTAPDKLPEELIAERASSSDKGHLFSKKKVE